MNGNAETLKHTKEHSESTREISILEFDHITKLLLSFKVMIMVLRSCLEKQPVMLKMHTEIFIDDIISGICFKIMRIGVCRGIDKTRLVTIYFYKWWAFFIIES